MYCICLIPFFSLFELLEIFENIENIVFIFLFGIKIFNTVPVLFRGFNFTISVKFRLALSLNI